MIEELKLKVVYIAENSAIGNSGKGNDANFVSSFFCMRIFSSIMLFMLAYITCYLLWLCLCVFHFQSQIGHSSNYEDVSIQFFPFPRNNLSMLLQFISNCCLYKWILIIPAVHLHACHSSAKWNEIPRKLGRGNKMQMHI